MKLCYIIWLLCFLILLQIGWIGLRLRQIKKRDFEAWQKQQEQKQAQQEEIEKELALVEEPSLKENLPAGAKIWLEPSQLEANGEFELQVRIMTQKDIQNIGLILFYPQELLTLMIDDWSDEGGRATWSGDFSSDSLTTIKFSPKLGSRGKEAVLEWDFDKESLLDSNVLDTQGNDILEEARGAKIYLK